MFSLVRHSQPEAITGVILPEPDYGHIEPVPVIEGVAALQKHLVLMNKRAAALDAESEDIKFPGVFEVTPAHIRFIRETATDMAGRANLQSYKWLMRYLSQATSEMPIAEAQQRIEGVLLASGPARVSIAFSPYSPYPYRLGSDQRHELVSRLGYEPLTTDLADTRAYDAAHNIGITILEKARLHLER